MTHRGDSMIEVREDRRPATAIAASDSLQSEHAALRSSARRVEALLATLADTAPERAGEAEVREIQRQLGYFRRQLLDHLAHEERSGILELAVAAAPRFHRRVERLRGQHVELRERIDALVEEAAGTDWVRVHAHFVAFRRVLVTHDRAENNVVQRAYLEDLGGRG